MDNIQKRILFAYLKKIDKYDTMKRYLQQHIRNLKRNNPELFNKVTMKTILSNNNAVGILIFVLGSRYVDDYNIFRRKFSAI